MSNEYNKGIHHFYQNIYVYLNIIVVIKFYKIKLMSRYFAYICLFSYLLSFVFSQNCLGVQNPANSSVCFAQSSTKDSLLCCYYSANVTALNITTKTSGCFMVPSDSASTAEKYVKDALSSSNATGITFACNNSAIQIFSIFSVVALLVFSLF